MEDKNSYKTLLPVILIVSIVSIVSTGESGSDAGKTCSKEGGCPDESAKYAATVPRDIPGEMREALQTIATVEIYRAQREVAKYLEYAYLSLADHPDQAREVRMTAQQCKNQHLLASDLMNKFRVTAAHIVETMIPIIIDAVINLKDEELVKEALEQIIEEANEMKQEAETTRDKYMKIQDKLTKNMGNVQSWNKHVVDEKERIRVQMEGEKDQIKASNLAQEELNEEKRRLEDQLEMLQSDRDMWREQAGMAGQNMAGSSGASFPFTMAAGSALTGGIGDALLGIVGGLADMFSHNRRMKQFKIMMDAYREAQRSVERAYGERRDTIRQLHDQRKLASERLTELKKLGIETANFGDVQSLYDAFDQLGVVHVQLTRIIQFWSHVASALKALKSNAKPGKLFLSKDDTEHRDRFLVAIGRTSKGWSVFRSITAAYVKETDKEIYELYSFLSAPIDRMAAEKRAERQRQILLEIEIDIETTYPSLE